MTATIANSTPSRLLLLSLGWSWTLVTAQGIQAFRHHFTCRWQQQIRNDYVYTESGDPTGDDSSGSGDPSGDDSGSGNTSGQDPSAQGCMYFQNEFSGYATQHTCFALASPSSPSEGSSSTGSDSGSSGSESTPGGSPSTSSDTGDTSSHPTLNAGATDNNNASSSTNTGAIAGGVIGGLLGAAVVLLALFWFLKKRRHTNKAAEGAFADKTMVPDDDVEEFTPQSGGYPYGMQQSSSTNTNSNDMTPPPPPPPPHSALYNRSQ